MKQSIPLVDLKAQYRSIRDDIDGAIARVIGNTAFVAGTELASFEGAFARLCQSEHCVGCASGTDALRLALRGLGVGPGDEVITVSHTFIATVEAIVSVGATPVFVDIREDTLLMDVQAIESALSERTRAILPVHLYGQMVDMDPLLEIARARQLWVIEDAAQAHGATYRGRRAGSLGDAGAFSFYPGKNLGAYGEGGAVVTSNAGLTAWLRLMVDHGRISKHEHGEYGENNRLHALQAAILAAKLPHLEGWNQARRAIAGRYDGALAGTGRTRPVTIAETAEPVFHQYVVRVAQRDRVLADLHGAGIGAGVHYPIPVHRQPAYKGSAPDLPVTTAIADEILSLPVYPELSEELQGDVIEALLRATS